MLYISVADVGGTNSRFGYFTLDGDLTLHGTSQCATADLHSTGDALAQAAASGLDPAKAQRVVWAVAGPVHDPLRARPTNATLELDVSCLENARLINDFVAQAWATLTLPGQEAMVILPGATHPTAPRGVLGAGTGLGTASLVHTHHGWLVLPAEGGHAAFALLGQQEQRFGDFLCAALDISYATGDHILSGRGLTLLHHFLTGEHCEPAQAAAQGLRPGSPTLPFFARLYGRMCRHWALQTLCTGGLYITGGIAVKNPAILHCPQFVEEFHAGPAGMEKLLHSISVRLMTSPHAGLWGAARAAASFDC